MNKAERHAAKCQEPMDLGVKTQKAFAARQAKLVLRSIWPLTRWYNDEDFCRAYNTAVALQADVKRLRQLCSEVLLIWGGGTAKQRFAVEGKLREAAGGE